MDDKVINEALIEKNVFLIIDQQVTQLVKDVTRIGRQLDNDIVIQENFVSRCHAEIRCEEGKYILYDQKSTSGTFVNDRRIVRCVLNSGDLIALGTLQIMYVNNNPKLSKESSGTTRVLCLRRPRKKKNDGK